MKSITGITGLLYLRGKCIFTYRVKKGVIPVMKFSSIRNEGVSQRELKLTNNQNGRNKQNKSTKIL